MYRRPVLAPGLRVLDRGRHQLQIGIDPARALRLATTEDLRRTLEYLDRGEVPPRDRGARQSLAALAPVLVDADRLAPNGIAPGDAAAAAVSDPRGFADRLTARRSRSVRVVGELGPDPAPLLEAAGICVADRTDAGDSEVDAVLVLGTGEPDRGLLDPLVRHGVPHLCVRAIDGVMVVGPLVAPGLTACLRCLDAHQAAADPLYPALAAVHHRIRRGDGVAEPVDTALATLAVAWAVRDLVSHLDGERAATWSATIRFGPDLANLTFVHWLRHHECGCLWSGPEVSSATMAR